MRPIVNGLEEEFSGLVEFHFLNATDGGQGQQAFQNMGLPGHPSCVIFLPDGTEVYRRFGLIEVKNLRDAIQQSLAAIPTP